MATSIERHTPPALTIDVPEAELRFRATFNQAAVGMAHLNLEGKWLQVNQKLCDIIGYTQEELIKLTFQDITHPEDLNKDLELAKKVLAGEISTYSLEKRYFRKEGKITWINLTVSLVRDVLNKPAYFISVIEDINQRKEVEFKLLQSRHELERNVRLEVQKRQNAQTQLNNFFLLSNDIIIIFNLDRTVRQANSSLKRILGYEDHEVIGKKMIDWVYAEDIESTFKNHKTMFNDQMHLNFENRLHHKNGSLVWLSWSFVSLTEDGAIFAIARDITGAKLQEKMIAEQKMKMANVSKMNSLTRMASGIAHEINNPMMIIYGHIYLLKKFLRNNSEIKSDYLTEGLSKIEAVAERVKKIVAGLRSFARDASRDPFEEVSLVSIINDTVALCRHRLSRENVTLTLPVDSEQYLVRGQAVQLCQVLLNLLENSFDAIKAKSESPWIHIRCRLDEAEGFAYLAISDSGPELDDSTKDNLFQPFFTTKAVGKGTGLGLSISKSIMDLHEGDLYLDSAEAHTTFVMKIPKA